MHVVQNSTPDIQAAELPGGEIVEDIGGGLGVSTGVHVEEQFVVDADVRVRAPDVRSEIVDTRVGHNIVLLAVVLSRLIGLREELQVGLRDVVDARGRDDVSGKRLAYDPGAVEHRVLRIIKLEAGTEAEQCGEVAATL